MMKHYEQTLVGEYHMQSVLYEIFAKLWNQAMVPTDIRKLQIPIFR